MSELYENKTVIVPEYNFDKIKDVINDYLSKNKVEQTWSNGYVYSKTVKCNSVYVCGHDEDILLMNLIYIVEGHREEVVDEDFPDCKKFNKFLDDLSEQLPEDVIIKFPSWYNAR